MFANVWRRVKGDKGEGTWRKVNVCINQGYDQQKSQYI